MNPLCAEVGSVYHENGNKLNLGLEGFICWFGITVVLLLPLGNSVIRERLHVLLEYSSLCESTADWERLYVTGRSVCQSPRAELHAVLRQV